MTDQTDIQAFEGQSFGLYSLGEFFLLDTQIEPEQMESQMLQDALKN
jgi:hypothetical protein